MFTRTNPLDPALRRLFIQIERFNRFHNQFLSRQQCPFSLFTSSLENFVCPAEVAEEGLHAEIFLQIIHAF